MRLLLASLIAVTASAASAQEKSVDVELGLSSLGVYIAPSYGISHNVRLRAPLYIANASRNADIDGNTIRADVNVKSIAVMADYYIASSPFRVSGGLSFGGSYELTGVLRNPTLDGIQFTGDFSTTIKQKTNLAPVLAVGIQGHVAKNIGLMAEIGFRVASFNLTTTGQENLPLEQTRTDFDNSIQKINNDLDKVNVIPFLTLGVVYRF